MHIRTGDKPSAQSGCNTRVTKCASLTILVVDGDDSFRSGLAANLQDDHHPVIECRSPHGVPPFETLSAIDALLLDYQRSGDDRLEFARRFHRLYPHVPIVVATAQCSPALEQTARDLGFLVYKPIDYEELHALLHGVTLYPERGLPAPDATP